MIELALDAVATVAIEDGGRKEIDIKRYAKTEKIPGGDIEDCRVLKGVMINKDVVHAKMRRKIERPRILLLEEENAIKEMCANIIEVKPDLVVTEKGVSDL